MSEDHRKTWEEREKLTFERLSTLTPKVLLYAAFLGGTFRVHDLTGGTGLKEQEVLEVLYGMIEAGAARETHGGKIESYCYPYVYSPDFKFIEVGQGDPPVYAPVYTIDFAYIEKRRQFNAAAVVLWKTISGT